MSPSTGGSAQTADAGLLAAGGRQHSLRKKPPDPRLPGGGRAVDPRNSGATLPRVLLRGQLVQSSKTAGSEEIERR